MVTAATSRILSSSTIITSLPQPIPSSPSPSQENAAFLSNPTALLTLVLLALAALSLLGAHIRIHRIRNPPLRNARDQLRHLDALVPHALSQQRRQTPVALALRVQQHEHLARLARPARVPHHVAPDHHRVVRIGVGRQLGEDDERVDGEAARFAQRVRVRAHDGLRAVQEGGRGVGFEVEGGAVGTAQGGERGGRARVRGPDDNYARARGGREGLVRREDAGGERVEGGDARGDAGRIDGVRVVGAVAVDGAAARDGPDVEGVEVDGGAFVGLEGGVSAGREVR